MFVLRKTSYGFVHISQALRSTELVVIVVRNDPRVYGVLARVFETSIAKKVKQQQILEVGDRSLLPELCPKR